MSDTALKVVAANLLIIAVITMGLICSLLRSLIVPFLFSVILMYLFKPFVDFVSQPFHLFGWCRCGKRQETEAGYAVLALCAELCFCCRILLCLAPVSGTCCDCSSRCCCHLPPPLFIIASTSSAKSMLIEPRTDSCTLNIVFSVRKPVWLSFHTDLGVNRQFEH